MKLAHLIYWCGYFALILGGSSLVMKRIILVAAPSVFLLSLMWIWNGLLIFLGKNPVFNLRPPRFARSSGCMIFTMGVVWLVSSMTPLAKSGMFMFVLSVPFVLLIIIAKKRFKE